MKVLTELLQFALKLVFTMSFMVCCSQEKKILSINGFLDNHTYNSAYEDTIKYTSKNIFSVTEYKKPQNKGSISARFNGIPYTKQTYTEYLQDGRKKYSQYRSSETFITEKFHYDKNELILKETAESKYGNSYKWLFYNPDGLLDEEIYYKSDQRKKNFFEGYTKYHYSSDEKKTNVKIMDYGYDSLANEEKYEFEFPILTKTTPLYQSKVHEYRWINGKYQPTKIKDYIVENRDVTFEYDESGRLTSEIWYQNHNSLENKTEFSYSDNYKNQTEQQYHILGTEKSTKITRKYDEHKNLVFEQSIEYTGHPLSENTFEYVYDKQGNWTSKKHFRKDVDSGINAEKELIDYEYREIKYYNSATVQRNFKLPELPEIANSIRNNIPKIAIHKKKKIEDFDTAVKNGDFETQINLKKAKNIEDFTPEFWTLKAKEFGNLDDEAGDEAVCVYETPIEGDLGFEQALVIFKKAGEDWTLWHQSTKPVLSTAHGGMMGNPFEGISIRNKTIIVSHFGGSRQKWSYTHRYRFQNQNWYLIGASVNFGSPCDYFDSLDYNLSTGIAVFEHSSEDCSDNIDKPKTSRWKETVSKKIQLPLMDEFSVGENRIELKTRKTEMFY